ncbi:branched-chain amino acid transport system permease protein [Roseovarius sp. MBR-79]
MQTRITLKRGPRIALGEGLCLAIVLLAGLLPLVSSNILAQSIGSQVMIGLCGALGVHIMLRLGLLNFAVPGFMAIGGYAAAIAAQYGLTDIFGLLLVAFGAPFLVALPLGLVTLRLKGVYFVLVTYLLTEIVQLVIVETPSLTGGTNGLIGFPPAEFFGQMMISGAAVYWTTWAAAFTAILICTLAIAAFGDRFDSMAHNETLSRSFGMDAARYKVIAFAVSAGASGLGGFGLVSTLITAHPLSFTAATSVNYIAYVLIGGAASTLGAGLGTLILITALSQVSFTGEWSLGLFGLLLVLAVLFLRQGITGFIAGCSAKLSPLLSFKNRFARGNDTL